MGLTLLARLSVYLQNRTYIDIAAQYQLDFAKYLMDPKEKVIYHGYNFQDNEHSCCKWGRANGWSIMAQTEILLALSNFTNHPLTSEVKALFSSMAYGIKKYQSENGLWHQLVDDPHTFLETSSSSMFLFSFVTGVINGWLPKNDFDKTIMMGWKGLLSVIQDDGQVTGICEGTGIGTSTDFYNSRGTKYLDSAPGLGAVLRATSSMHYYLLHI
eukprot:TRINITY_DN4492_c0_g1_i2.p1 TRINITY_DN4492_c0_g1~~TRINITY_DN4492_c0_g1_i2.p1  ORF type:complete len:214 (-),score=30.47 TRINITY_DN4492_c0_g1_i2:75-716(-)